MIPLSDDNPTLRVPVATILLLAAMLSAWLIIQGLSWSQQRTISPYSGFLPMICYTTFLTVPIYR